MMIIGISGPAGSGKDTVAHIANEMFGCAFIAQADPLKVICRQVFGWTDAVLWGESARREEPDSKGIVPRKALQTLGTEWGRALYEDLWVDRAIARARALKEGSLDPERLWVEHLGADAPYYYSRTRPGCCALIPSRYVLITDVRFPNEVRKIQAAGGVVVAVVGRSRDLGAFKCHESEASFEAIQGMSGVRTIDNSGYLEDLRDRVRSFLGGLS